MFWFAVLSVYVILAESPNIFNTVLFGIYMDRSASYTDWNEAWPWFATLSFSFSCLTYLEVIGWAWGLFILLYMIFDWDFLEIGIWS